MVTHVVALLHNTTGGHNPEHVVVGRLAVGLVGLRERLDPAGGIRALSRHHWWKTGVELVEEEVEEVEEELGEDCTRGFWVSSAIKLLLEETTKAPRAGLDRRRERTPRAYDPQRWTPVRPQDSPPARTHEEPP
ncbi:unnamed protein product [Gadus morhua 'NCC']